MAAHPNASIRPSRYGSGMSVPIDRSALRSLVSNVSAKCSNRTVSFCLFIFSTFIGFSVFRRIVHEHVLTVLDCPRVGVVSVVSVAQAVFGAFPFPVRLVSEPFNDLAQRFASHAHLSPSIRRCCLTVLRSTHSPSSSSVMPFSFFEQRHAVIFNAFRPHCVKIFRTFIDFLNGRMLTHFVIFSFRFFGFDEAVAPARSPHVLLSDAVDAANIRVGYDLSAFSIHQIASSSFQYMSA